MIRSCIVPNEEFEHVCKETIIRACELFYNLYFELFGQKNCTYSVHIVSSHLLKMRGNEPLTSRSAFPYESFYSEMRNLYKPGTTAPAKKILKNTIMKRTLEYHTCSRTIYYSKHKENNKTMENNSLIYTFKNNEHQLFIIQDEINEGEFLCKKQGKFEYQTTILPNIKWSSIGVYKRGAVGRELYIIKKKDVKGKFLNVLNLMITCPINVLEEK